MKFSSKFSTISQIDKGSLTHFYTNGRSRSGIVVSSNTYSRLYWLQCWQVSTQGIFRWSIRFKTCIENSALFLVELHPESIEEFKYLFCNTSVVSNTEILLHPHEVAPTKISMNPNKHYEVCYGDLVTVKAGIIKHSVPCVGYILEEDEKTGKLNVEYLKSLNIKPGPLYGKLKMGESITLENGKVVHSKDCVGPNVKGKKIAILGDTYNADNVSELVMNPDILIHESTNENADQTKSIEHGHSTAGNMNTLLRSSS